MNGLAGRYLDEQHAPAARWQGRHPVQAEVQWRFDAVRTYFGHKVRQCVQPCRIERLRLAIVRNAQDKTAAAGVGERCELVRESVPVRGGDLLAAKPSFLELKTGIFTEPDLFPKTRGIDWHRFYPTLPPIG